MDKISNELKELLEKVKEKYILPEDKPFVIINKAKELVACNLLIEQMEYLGAPKEDMLRVLSYMAVMADAEKNRLDWPKAYEDYDIDSLIEIYVGGDKSEN